MIKIREEEDSIILDRERDILDLKAEIINLKKRLSDSTEEEKKDINDDIGKLNDRIKAIQDEMKDIKGVPKNEGMGSKNRDFRTGDRGIGRRLRLHKMMMDAGMESNEAFKIISNMPYISWGTKTLSNKEIATIKQYSGLPDESIDRISSFSF